MRILENGPPRMVFAKANGEAVMSIEPDGRLVAGPGLSAEAATQELFATMARVWPEFLRQWAAEHKI